MSGNTVQRFDPASDDTSYPIDPAQDFARRLYRHMNAKGWTNSDLARSVWGERTNARGYVEAKGRDRISVYLKGETIPEATTLKMLAEALGVDEADLCPSRLKSALAWEPQSVSLAVAPGHPDKGRLQIDRIIPFTLAAKIISLLAEYDEKGAA